MVVAVAVVVVVRWWWWEGCSRWILFSSFQLLFWVLLFVDAVVMDFYASVFFLFYFSFLGIVFIFRDLGSFLYLFASEFSTTSNSVDFFPLKYFFN